MLITADYLQEQRALHQKESHYGSRGFNWAYLIAGMRLIEGCQDVLDYGCGKGSLGDLLRNHRIPCVDYDPAVEQFKGNARRCDLVVCIDVLEHIEPDCIEAVVGHLRTMTKRILFVTVCQRLAGRKLSDGRNAHILIRDTKWWRDMFARHGFKLRREWPSPEGDPHWIAMLQV